MVVSDPRYSSDSIDTVSQSSLETYLRCGIRYRFELLDGLPRRVTQAMAVGTGVATGAKLDLQSKAACIQLPHPQEIVDAAVAGYDAEIATTEHDLAPYAVGLGRDDTSRGALAYAIDVSPQYRSVVQAETEMSASAGTWRLVGTPDVITPDGIGDLKTGRQWSLARADSSRQLTAYSILHYAQWGALPRMVWIDSLSPDRRKGTWTYVRRPSVRNLRHVAAYIAIAESALKAIQAGVFLPAPEGAWWCSATWCPHHRYCPAFTGKTQEDDE